MDRKWTADLKAVLKSILFIGFSVQIVLGVCWMCCNFAHVQNFPAADSALYRGLYRLVGECAPVMYLLQLAVAFGVNYFFLQSLKPVKGWFAVWRALALLTFPFAMQCHLVLQPHSLVGSLFLGMLLFVIRGIRGQKGWYFSPVCLALLVVLSGVTDRDSREELATRGVESMLASRMAWSTMGKDFERWPVEIQALTKNVYMEVYFYPDNMELLFEAVEASVDMQTAREYYNVIARTAWEMRKSLIIPEMVWDFLGYTVSPVIVPLQLRGVGYDSYTPRNYENMRNACPVLTKHYVDYSCWWFGVMLVLSVVCGMLWAVNRRTRRKDTAFREETGRRSVFRSVGLPVIVCVVLSGIWVLVFTMRGGGVMDYKWSFAVNQLWLLPAMQSLVCGSER